MPHIRIKAVWDPEAEVGVAESEDVPGLVTEAESVEREDNTDVDEVV